MYFEDNQEIQFKLAKDYAKKRFYKIKDDFKYFKKPLDKRKIKVGYISSDFRDHLVTKLVCRIIRLHDRNKFKVNSYSLFDEIEDEYNNYEKEGVNKIFKLSHKSYDEIDDLIRSDNLDISIDLMGYSKNSHPRIFAKRIAPIHISNLSFPVTMGSTFIDYINAVKILIPNKDQEFFLKK